MVKARPRILIVDDDRTFVDNLSQMIGEDYECEKLYSALHCRELNDYGQYDVIMLDIRFPEPISGLDLLREIKISDPYVPVIMISDTESAPVVVEAMKRGASDYIGKTPDRQQLKLTITKAIQEVRRNETLGLLRQEIDSRVGQLVGNSEALQRIRRQIDKVSCSTSPVLLLGESGTGKELVARAIHRRSAQRNHPFIAVNCAAIPEGLLESELFGHEKGAFTDARRQKKGQFELAGEGTIFLDEIADIALPHQAKLLRVLQEREFRRVGGEMDIQLSCRVIAATNKTLMREIEAGRFRDDLYWRLAVVKIQVPPLRERKADIPLLTKHFIQRKASEQKKRVMGVDRETLEAMVAYSWPGNIRELENCIECAIVHAEGEILTRELFPQLSPGERAAIPSYGVEKERALHRFQRDYIKTMLSLTNNNITQAATKMGVTRQGLLKMMKEIGLR